MGYHVQYFRILSCHTNNDNHTNDNNNTYYYCYVSCVLDQLCMHCVASCHTVSYPWLYPCQRRTIDLSINILHRSTSQTPKAPSRRCKQEQRHVAPTPSEPGTRAGQQGISLWGTSAAQYATTAGVFLLHVANSIYTLLLLVWFMIRK